MKQISLLIIGFLVLSNINAQTFSTNRTPVGLEHNILFNATTRYTITQSGAAQINLAALFDGRMAPVYSSVALNQNDPTIIEISNLPNAHTQGGAWFGWSTRYWMPTRFLMEGYDVYYGNGWTTVADYTSTDYTGNYNFVQKMPSGSYTKLRITIYKSNGEGGKFGLSELFYIHPEVSPPYSGLYKTYSSIYESAGKIGIGKSDPQNTLDVNGTIHAKEVKIDLNGWSDFVFSSNYNLRTLAETEQFINENGHLPEIPSVTEVEQEGISLGEMNAKLLQKIEELTLYNIEMNKKIEMLIEKNEILDNEIEQLKNTK